MLDGTVVVVVVVVVVMVMRIPRLTRARRPSGATYGWHFLNFKLSHGRERAGAAGGDSSIQNHCVSFRFSLACLLPVSIEE